MDYFTGVHKQQREKIELRLTPPRAVFIFYTWDEL